MGGVTMISDAKRAATDRYDAKTYHKVMFKLRKEDDAEIIKDMDEAFNKGMKRREWLRMVFDVYKEHKK